MEGHAPRNIAADSSRYASTPRDGPAKKPRLDASTPDSTPPSRSLHLQIDGENRSCSSEAEQVCEKWTLTASPQNSLIASGNSLFFQNNSLYECAGNFGPRPRFNRAKWATLTPKNRPKIAESLLFSLFREFGCRDGFDRDCLHRHWPNFRARPAVLGANRRS